MSVNESVPPAPISGSRDDDADRSSNGEGSDGEVGDDSCPVCLQRLLQPVRMPCRHIFCFLCVKGALVRNSVCPLCRTPVPAQYLDNPVLVTPPPKQQPEKRHRAPQEVAGQAEAAPAQVEYRWFYEGNNGWWQYDDRTNEELETSHAKGETSCIVPISGFPYIVDFNNMVQARRSHPNRIRRVKRDRIDTPKKGIAGIKMDEHGNSNQCAPTPSQLQQQSLPSQQMSSEAAAASISRDSHPGSSNLSRRINALTNMLSQASLEPSGARQADEEESEDVPRMPGSRDGPSRVALRRRRAHSQNPNLNSREVNQQALPQGRLGVSQQQPLSLMRGSDREFSSSASAAAAAAAAPSAPTSLPFASGTSREQLESTTRSSNSHERDHTRREERSNQAHRNRYRE